MTDMIITIDGIAGTDVLNIETPSPVVSIDGALDTTAIAVEVPSPIQVISILDQGPPGPKGESGTTDPATVSTIGGIIVGGGLNVTDTGLLSVSQAVYDRFYEFDQAFPASTWSIVHMMNKYPSVTVIDSAGATCYGKITYTDANSLVVSFNASFSGKAYLN